MDPKIRERFNHQTVQRHVPDLAAIIDRTPHVAVYTLDLQTKRWEKQGCEGTLFVYSTHSHTKGVIVLNRNSPDNWVMDLGLTKRVELKEQLLIVKTMGDADEDAVSALWIFQKNDCERLKALLEGEVGEKKRNAGRRANPGTTAAEQAAAATTVIGAQTFHEAPGHDAYHYKQGEGYGGTRPPTTSTVAAGHDHDGGIGMDLLRLLKSTPGGTTTQYQPPPETLPPIAHDSPLPPVPGAPRPRIPVHHHLQAGPEPHVPQHEEDHLTKLFRMAASGVKGRSDAKKPPDRGGGAQEVHATTTGDDMEISPGWKDSAASAIGQAFFGAGHQAHDKVGFVNRVRWLLKNDPEFVTLAFQHFRKIMPGPNV